MTESEPARPRAPVLFGILTAIGVTLLFQLGASIARTRAEGTDLGPWILAISQVFLMLAPTLYVARAQSLPSRDLFRLRSASWKMYAAVVAGIVALWPIEQAFMMVQEIYLIPDGFLDSYRRFQRELESLYDQLFPPGGSLILLRSLLIGALIPAVSEEILFRGAVQRSFEERMSPAVAIGVTALLFAFLHLQPNNAVPLLLLAGFLGLVARAGRSIWPAVVGHFLFNAAMLGALYYLRAAGEPLGGPHTEEDLVAIAPLAAFAVLPTVFIVRWLIRQIRRPE